MYKSVHGQRDEKGFNLSPKARKMIYLVISMPSVIQNGVKATYKPYTNQHIMNKKAERERNHLVLDSGCVWGETKWFCLPLKATLGCSHMINVVVSIVQVITVRPRA